MVVSLLKIPNRYFMPMTETQSRQFMQCHNLERQYIKPFDAKSQSIKIRSDPFLRIIHDRLTTWGSAEISMAVGIFLLSLVNSPKSAIMWAYTLNKIYHQNNNRMVTMNDIADLFPLGFPTRKGIRYAWQQQKSTDAPHGNLLDDPKVWKRSYQFSYAS